MNERNIKILTTLTKIVGILTALAGHVEMIPTKWQWIGALAVLLASTLKDVIMMLGDLWDDGQINKSYNPEQIKPEIKP
ncbi:MAG: hypothetical protein Q7T74_00135 [Candidatus Saccharibacteria bacterium]|nr:hypothetical protein [Candidatus Saccharibacteria bacterium]